MFSLVLAGLFGVTMTSINALIAQYGYLAIFLMLVLEAASLPLPSEVVLPAVGYLAAIGQVNVILAFVVVILGGAVGMAIDYYVAYFLEKDVVYKHLGLFHVKKEHLKAFDSWFMKNGAFVVFVARLLPLVRGLINFPAGFAKMDIKKFYAYSIPGNAIWAALLIAFGYYALSLNNLNLVALLVFGLCVFVYAVYRVAMKMISGEK